MTCSGHYNQSHSQLFIQHEQPLQFFSWGIFIQYIPYIFLNFIHLLSICVAYDVNDKSR